MNQNLRLFAAPDAPVKIAHLRLQNLWERPRRITVTYYAEWVLGTTRDTQQAHIMPEFDPDKNALLASNRFNSEFGERVAFLAANKKPHGVTTDRTEFLGRLGSLRSPAALGRIGLASAVNAGLDPCAAIQLHVDLAPGAVEEVFFLIGEGANRAESLALIGQVQAQGQVESIWQAVQKQWDDILNTITVETPDPGMDLMLNRWLLYQTLCLPPVGAHRVVSIQRSLWVPRPTPGCAGAAAYPPGPGARTDFGSGAASIRGGRCAALVESACGARGAHPLFG